MHRNHGQGVSEGTVVIDWDFLEGLSLLSFAFYTFLLAVATPKVFVPNFVIVISAIVEAARWLAVVSLVSNSPGPRELHITNLSRVYLAFQSFQLLLTLTLRVLSKVSTTHNL